MREFRFFSLQTRQPTLFLAGAVCVMGILLSNSSLADDPAPPVSASTDGSPSPQMSPSPGVSPRVEPQSAHSQGGFWKWLTGGSRADSDITGQVQSTEDAQVGDPQAMQGVSPEDVNEKGNLEPKGPRTTTMPWRAPDYSGQTAALGWTPEAFQVPPGMKERVKFWVDIYSRYTSFQGVLHDSIYVDFVYETLDFSDIMKDPTKNIYQKAHAKEKYIKERKQIVAERLKRLQKLSTPDGLSGDDLKTWNLFAGIRDPKKFQDAAEKGRLRFQLGQRDHFRLGVYYSGRYLNEMERIFKAEGLPIEITRLPFVESSFNLYARSRVGASGIWQFMPRTARSYMMVGHQVDERNDPLRATRASAKMLKGNYNLLGAWPLAITGYNHGPSGIKRITEKLKTKDIVEIINNYSSSSFGFASENFYACFLAALEVEKNASQYFGSEIKWSAPLKQVDIKVTKSFPYSSLLALFDGEDDWAALYNPHFTSQVRKGGRGMIPVRSTIWVRPERFELAEKLATGKVAPPAFKLAMKDIVKLSWD